MTTDRFDSIKDPGTPPGQVGRTRLYRLRFDEHRKPGGRRNDHDAARRAPGRVQMFDNMTIDRQGRILLQEDPGNQAYIAKIWRVLRRRRTRSTRSPTTTRAGSRRAPPGFLTQDEESSRDHPGAVPRRGLVPRRRPGALRRSRRANSSRAGSCSRCTSRRARSRRLTRGRRAGTVRPVRRVALVAAVLAACAAAPASAREEAPAARRGRDVLPRHRGAVAPRHRPRHDLRDHRQPRRDVRVREAVGAAALRAARLALGPGPLGAARVPVPRHHPVRREGGGRRLRQEQRPRVRLGAEVLGCLATAELAEQRARTLAPLVERPGHVPTVPGGPDGNRALRDGSVSAEARASCW